MHNKFYTIIILISLFIGISNFSPAQPVVAVYYRSWTNLPAPDKIQFNNLTHIIQAFAYPDSQGNLGFFAGVPNSALIQAAHSANKKILLSFGGQINSDGFGVMTSDSVYRSNFIKNVVTVLSQNDYDGIDIDWEFPSKQQGSQLTVLIKELRQKFDSLNTAWLITLAAPATAYYGQNFQYDSMNTYVDWYSILSYGYHGSFTNHSGPLAPLYQSPIDNDGCVSASAGYMYFARKVPTNKLLLGIPFYGIRFNSAGLYKPYTGDIPDLTYSQVIDTLNSSGWNYLWDNVSSVPYLQDTGHTRFISFDDTMSVRLKTEYSFSKNLGGIMVWAMDQDMINNSQPLLESIGSAVRNHATGIESQSPISPDAFNLYNNYPNPFNPSTIIKFSLSENSTVKLIIYDVLGREIKTLLNSSLTTGIHTTTFDGSNIPSGIYFYVLTAGTKSMSKKMILLK